jgi:hypothetical protein
MCRELRRYHDYVSDCADVAFILFSEYATTKCTICGCVDISRWKRSGMRAAGSGLRSCATECEITFGWEENERLLMNDTEYKPVVVNLEPSPQVLKSTWWDWVRFYLYNLWRKPEVLRKQRELLRIVSAVKLDMSMEVLPYLWEGRTTCKDCADMYGMLKPQVFLSQIERILKADHYHENSNRINAFYKKHEDEFKRSEALSRWINGFV